MLHREGWRITGDPARRLRFRDAHGEEIPTAALRPREPSGSPPRPIPEPTDAAIEYREPHSVDPLDEFALDVTLHHWLEPPP